MRGTKFKSIAWNVLGIVTRDVFGFIFTVIFAGGLVYVAGAGKEIWGWRDYWALAITIPAGIIWAIIAKSDDIDDKKVKENKDFLEQTVKECVYEKGQIS